MPDDRCILVGDDSAYHYLMHTDSATSMKHANRLTNLFASCASSAGELQAFNTAHPLFGGEPVTILVPSRNLRVRNQHVVGHLITGEIPNSSFIKLRDNLYVASPELTFTRMGNYVSEVKLAEIGCNLCGRFYVDVTSKSILTRSSFLTNPEKMKAYTSKMSGLRGGGKAARALRWVISNSGSPYETKMALLYRLPLWIGGFALPFDQMNYDIRARKDHKLAEQGRYCIDLASVKHRVGLEYDGIEYHRDVGRDTRRRNALNAMGWSIFPTNKEILSDAKASEKLAFQIAKKMGVRVQPPKDWSIRHSKLRKELELPE